MYHATRHGQYLVTPWRAMQTASGIEFAETATGESLLEKALGARRVFDKWELLQALRALLGCDAEELVELQNKSQQAMLHRLIHVVFDGQEKRIAEIIELYNRPHEPEIEVPDADMALLLEELAISDHVNSGDLKAWKDDVQKKTMTALNRQRAKDRKERAATMAANKRKKVAKGRKVKIGKMAKGVLRRKRKGHAGSPGHGDAVAKKSKTDAGSEAGGLPPAPTTVADEAPKIVRGPPKSSDVWEVVEVPGGWLRFSEKHQRLDSHCNRCADANCKMDRSLAKSPLGLHIAWLSEEFHGDKKEHDDLKWVLSQADRFDQRDKARARFMELAAESGGTYSRILEAEEKAAGSSGEPLTLHCLFRG